MKFKPPLSLNTIEINWGPSFDYTPVFSHLIPAHISLKALNHPNCDCHYHQNHLRA
jgi:hypothetical protein